jgi:probable F420-dependent oxidoreductase
MLLSLNYHATDQSMSPVALAVEAEARGFHGLYLPEHTHIPASRETPAPNGEAELPEMYWRTFDPFVMLAAVAQATTGLVVGTSVALPAQHDPVSLAKQVATLDVISGGRVVLGVGFGWNREEMATHGVVFASRREQVAEAVQCMRALWTEHEASFTGRHYRLEPSWAYPKPVQAGGPPVVLGGAAGPKLFAAIAEWGDGWMPIGAGGLARTLPDLRLAVEAAGRDPDALRIAPMAVEPTLEKLDYYRTLGITEVGLRLPTAPRDEVLATLDAYAAYLDHALAGS